MIAFLVDELNGCIDAPPDKEKRKKEVQNLHILKKRKYSLGQLPNL